MELAPGLYKRRPAAFRSFLKGSPQSVQVWVSRLDRTAGEPFNSKIDVSKTVADLKCVITSLRSFEQPFELRLKFRHVSLAPQD